MSKELKSRVKYGDWLRAKSILFGKYGRREVPVPVFRWAIRGIAWVSVASCLLAAGVSGRAEEQGPRHLRHVVYAQHGEEELDADVFLPGTAGPHPGVLLVHGGSWARGHKAEMKFVGKLLAERGYTAVSIRYRLAPKHPFPAQLEDCCAAVRWMRTNCEEYKIDPQRVGGYGYSAGGHLVALMATMADDTPATTDNEAKSDTVAPSPRLQAVVCGGAPFDFREVPEDDPTYVFWLGATRKDRPEPYHRASPLSFVSRDDPPMFLFCGQRDRFVDPSGSRSMLVELKRAGVPAEILELPDQGHFDAMYDRQAPVEGVKFFDRHLKGLPEQADQVAAP